MPKHRDVRLTVPVGVAKRMQQVPAVAVVPALFALLAFVAERRRAGVAALPVVAGAPGRVAAHLNEQLHSKIWARLGDVQCGPPGAQPG